MNNLLNLVLELMLILTVGFLFKSCVSNKDIVHYSYISSCDTIYVERVFFENRTIFTEEFISNKFYQKDTFRIKDKKVQFCRQGKFYNLFPLEDAIFIARDRDSSSSVFYFSNELMLETQVDTKEGVTAFKRTDDLLFCFDYKKAVVEEKVYKSELRKIKSKNENKQNSLHPAFWE
jgi:hypothetical protein